MDRKMMDLIGEAERFLQNYFGANPAELVNLYRGDSVMNFDGQKIQGREAILARLTWLQQVRRQVREIKCLPVSGTDLSSGLHGVVSGCIWLDGQQGARFFSQMFILHPTPEGSFDVSHTIFFLDPKSSGTALASSTTPSV